ncbi:MAG: prepilin-type N-terminal cleavage/methylation domain-containing protein [Sedimentisphaerales bacterium]|nr:prepilin-type N-terminal cleavage/methylation domain-containing protein [Sedimentisphaerales bacterium]
MITKRTKGFTLVEILIVVIILGILAAIIIPQFTDASQDARRSSVQSNLQAMRSQFELYRAQHLDQYPWDSDDTAGVALADDSVIATNLTGKTNSAGEAGAVDSTLGPYMQKIPVNPFATGAARVFDFGKAPTKKVDAPTAQWIIDESTGAIYDGSGVVLEAEAEED